VLKAAEQDRPDVASQRAAWVLQQAGLDPDKLVFLDETSAKTNMVRLYGRSPQGQRLVEKVPYGHWKSTTFLAALRSTGLTAPMVIDGAMNGPLFLAYLQQILTPTLKPGDVVVMDNLPAHKVAGVKEIVEKAGAQVLYLPPYSPDLNPIELVFSKLKWLLRSAQERDVEKLWKTCGVLMDRFSPDECRNYLNHCGYRATLM
jgi:transposase